MDDSSIADTDVEKCADSDPESLVLEEPVAPQHVTASKSTEFLNGLRGLATFLVYMSHQIPWWYGKNNKLEHGFGYDGETYFGQLPFVRSLFTGGNAAVAIFFVLSGYVLSIAPLRLLRRRERTACYRHIMSAFIRRPLRLYIPPLGVSLLFAIIMQLPFGLAPTLAWPVPQSTFASEVGHWVAESLRMTNPFKRHGVSEPWYPYDPPAWTIAAEFQGSMLVFVLLYLTSFASPRYAMYLFSVTGAFLSLIYQWPLACFLGGMLLAANDLENLDVVLFSGRKTRGFLQHTAFFMGWFLLGQPGELHDPAASSGAWGWYTLTSFIPSIYYKNEYWRFYNTIGAVLLVFGVLRIPWVQRALSTRPLLFLGRIAFSLYLIHIPVIWTIGDRIYRIFGVTRQDFVTVFDNWLTLPDFGPQGLSTGFLVVQCILLPINIGLAKLGTRFLDQPSVRSGKWLIRKLGITQ